MTAQEIREKYFIAGTPVILCRRKPPVIGARIERAISENDDELTEIRGTVLRIATEEEYRATLKPEYRDLPWDSEINYFYEISVD